MLPVDDCCMFPHTFDLVLTADWSTDLVLVSRHYRSGLLRPVSVIWPRTVTLLVFIVQRKVWNAACQVIFVSPYVNCDESAKLVNDLHFSLGVTFKN